jgi:hypothetical protein
MRSSLVALDLDYDLLNECSQQLLRVTWRGGRGVPHPGKIRLDREQMIALYPREYAWTLLFAVRELRFSGFEGAQALFSLALGPTRNQTIVGINGTVSTAFIALPGQW